MSTIAYRAMLVREIEQTMKRIDTDTSQDSWYHAGKVVGQLDAYAHILTLIKDEYL